MGPWATICPVMQLNALGPHDSLSDHDTLLYPMFFGDGSANRRCPDCVCFFFFFGTIQPKEEGGGGSVTPCGVMQTLPTFLWRVGFCTKTGITAGRTPPSPILCWSQFLLQVTIP